MKKMVYQFPAKDKEDIIIQNVESAIQAWKEKVYDKQEEVDPSCEHLWLSLALGFALGFGYQLEQAYKFVDILDSKRLL